MKKLTVLLVLMAMIFSTGGILADDELPPPPPEDLEPPHSLITSPADGQTITSLPLVITGTATDNERVLTVELEIVDLTRTTTTDVLCTALSSDYSQWQYVWSNPPAGDYKITSIATDVYGNIQEELQTITIHVQPQGTPPPDTFPPALVILFPPVLDYQTNQSQLKIEGRTEAGATVSINGSSVLVEDNGYFSLDVTLNPGLNTFQVIAQDSSGNQTKLTLNVTLSGGTTTPTPAPTSTSSPSTATATVVLGIFPDLQGHWAQSLISTLLAKGIVSGYPDGTFKPDQTVTRAEFSAILCRALGITPSEKGSNFSDLQGHWAEKYVNPLVEKGLIKGYPDGTFAPDQPIKRCEIAAIMARALTLPPLIGKPTFSDIDTTHWAFGFVEAAASKGLIKGYPDGTFRPENSATRAEACAIVARSQGF